MNAPVAQKVTQKLSLSKSKILRFLLENGPFLMYCHCGFTGFGKPRYQFYDVPKNFNHGTFKWLKERNYIQLNIDDGFKEQWSISRSGIKALQMNDEEISAIDDRLLAARLEQPSHQYGHSYIDDTGQRRELPENETKVLEFKKTEGLES